jgi:hypothetical protein
MPNNTHCKHVGPIVSLIGTTERGRKPKHLANLEADPLKDPGTHLISRFWC